MLWIDEYATKIKKSKKLYI